MDKNKSPAVHQKSDEEEPDGQHPDLKEGLDYYFENGLMVFTEAFLAKRGYCCEQGCRHCPYGFSNFGK